MPEPLLRKFHFTFLIRHPRRAIPSYYRCTIPPLDKVTGFYHFLPSEAGYDELRRLFDFLKERGAIGPKVSQASRATNGEDGVNGDASLRNGSGHGAEGSGDGEVEITVIDADDLLDNPDKVIRSYCDAVGIDYSPDMLKWGDEASQRDAVNAFEKWKGFHEDAIGSTSLKPRENKLVGGAFFFFFSLYHFCTFVLTLHQRNFCSYPVLLTLDTFASSPLRSQ